MAAILGGTRREKMKKPISSCWQEGNGSAGHVEVLVSRHNIEPSWAFSRYHWSGKKVFIPTMISLPAINKKLTRYHFKIWSCNISLPGALPISFKAINRCRKVLVPKWAQNVRLLKKRKDCRPKETSCWRRRFGPSRILERPETWFAYPFTVVFPNLLIRIPFIFDTRGA